MMIVNDRLTPSIKDPKVKGKTCEAPSIYPC